MALANRGAGPGQLPISYLRRPRSMCPKCGRSLYAGSLAKTCKRRDCPGYVAVWMGDQRVRLLENLLAYGGLTCMLTLTAPGADALPWDVQACAHLGPHRHSGTRGCRVEATALRRFNEGSMRAWSALWNVVRSRVNREHGTGAAALLAYAPEPQQRGAIHFHLVFGAGSPRERAALDDIARDLATIGTGYGWGRVHRPEADDVGTRPDGRTANGLALFEAARAACYLSKYLSAEAKSGVRELVVGGQAPRRAVYVATRLTMRTLHDAQPAHAPVRLHGRSRTAPDARGRDVAAGLQAAVHVVVLSAPPEHAVGAARRRARMSFPTIAATARRRDGGDGTAARPCPPRAASARGGDRTGRRAPARRPAAAARPLAPPAE